MPNTCCVPGCRSGYKGVTEKVSLFRFPADKELSEKWKRAIPREEAGDFNFDSKYARVCDRHFHAAHIIRVEEFAVNGDAVSLQRGRPALRPDALPRIFEGLPGYLTKSKQRRRSPVARKQVKRRREPSCYSLPTQDAAEACSSATDPAAAGDDIDVVALTTTDSGRDRTSDAACQTDQVVGCVTCVEVQSLKRQLRAAKQQLEHCQKKVATLKVEVKKLQRLHQSVGNLSERGKLIFHQSVMKANAKSARAVRYKKEWLYDCLLLKIKSTAAYTFLHENDFLPLPNPRILYSYMKNLKADFGFDASLFTLLKEKLQEVPERERRGVVMFDEMSVRKNLHVRESDMKVMGKVNFGEHTQPGDQEKDADHVLVFLFRPFLGGWSQTVGTFCASSASPGSVIAKLLLECILHLSNSGAVVDAVTCDNSTSNRSALRSLGINGGMEHP
ncbi:uncharacterized protein LOC144097541 [Amblyomma americanum]